ncbi:MAG: hypothetical protein ABL949_13205 [Fimbriimonadaceae bacterium]
MSPVILAFALLSQGQVPTAPGMVNPAEELKKLSFLVGNWKGEGYMIASATEKKTFKITQKITTKLRGSVYVIDQEGEETNEGADKGKPIMEAFGIISFDATRGGFNMHLRSQGGQPVEGEAKLEKSDQAQETAATKTNDGNFVWGYGLPDGGYVRFTSQVKGNTWHEKGEITQDGKSFFTFMEMNLKK